MSTNTTWRAFYVAAMYWVNEPYPSIQDLST